MRSLALFVLAPLALGALNFAWKAPLRPAGPITTEDVGYRPDLPPRSHDRVAVLLVGNGGTEITDSLAPVEILGASGLYDVVTVAPERRASPFLNGLLQDAGLDLMPHYDLDGFEQAYGRDPDLILVPWLPGYAGVDAALVPWIREHAGPDTIVLSVCAGGLVVAETGLLDGRRATATYDMIPGLRETHPDVRWDEGVRHAVDGRFVSSSTLAAGIDATLAAVRLAGGPEAAERAAEVSGYRGLHRLDAPTLDPGKSPWGVLRGAWTFDRTDIAVLLDDGVREAAVAAQLDLWPQSLADTVTTVADDRLVRSRHGLDLIARRTDADGLDRIEATEVVEGVFPHDAVLRRIAEVEGAGPAHAAGTNMFYGAVPELEGPWQRFDLLWKPLAIGLFAAGASLAKRFLRGSL